LHSKLQPFQTERHVSARFTRFAGASLPAEASAQAGHRFSHRARWRKAGGKRRRGGRGEQHRGRAKGSSGPRIPSGGPDRLPGAALKGIVKRSSMCGFAFRRVRVFLMMALAAAMVVGGAATAMATPPAPLKAWSP